MVVNPALRLDGAGYTFESYVISYGSEPLSCLCKKPMKFESYVISYGSEPKFYEEHSEWMFESYVISYGSEPVPRAEAKKP